MKYRTINIAFKGGSTISWDAEKNEWDDYDYDGKVFIVKKDRVLVGLYNIDCIQGIVID